MCSFLIVKNGASHLHSLWALPACLLRFKVISLVWFDLFVLNDVAVMECLLGTQIISFARDGFYQQSSTSFRHVLDGQASDFVCSLMEQLRCYTAGCYHFLTDQHTRAMTSTGCNLLGCQTHRCYYCSQRHTHAHESSCTFTIHCFRHNLISGTRNRWKTKIRRTLTQIFWLAK